MMRRRFFIRPSGAREIARGAAILAAFALIIRVLLLLGAAERAERMLRDAAADGQFVKAALDFELGAAAPAWRPGGWEALIMWESAVMSAGFRAPPDSTEAPGDAEALRDTPGNPSAAPQTSAAPLEISGPAPAPLTIDPVSPNGRADGVYINNETAFNIDIDEFLNAEPGFTLDSDSAQILIVHTHASEAYYPDEEYYYVPTDNDRTEDTAFNVVRIGDEVASILEARGIKTIHDRGIYDYPTYSGSYTRTLEVIEGYLKKNPSLKIVLDIHRDYLEKSDGTVYKLVTNIDGADTAQIMLVMGTSEGGLPHPEWRENLKLGLRLQKAMNDKYPALARPLNLRRERFNQHATQGSMIVEMGSSGNTLGEALNAARLFADSLSGVLEEYK